MGDACVGGPSSPRLANTQQILSALAPAAVEKFLSVCKKRESLAVAMATDEKKKMKITVQIAIDTSDPTDGAYANPDGKDRREMVGKALSAAIEEVYDAKGVDSAERMGRIDISDDTSPEGKGLVEQKLQQFYNRVSVTLPIGTIIPGLARDSADLDSTNAKDALEKARDWCQERIRAMSRGLGDELSVYMCSTPKLGVEFVHYMRVSAKIQITDDVPAATVQGIVSDLDAPSAKYGNRFSEKLVTSFNRMVDKDTGLPAILSWVRTPVAASPLAWKPISAAEKAGRDLYKINDAFKAVLETKMRMTTADWMATGQFAPLFMHHYTIVKGTFLVPTRRARTPVELKVQWANLGSSDPGPSDKKIVNASLSNELKRKTEFSARELWSLPGFDSIDLIGASYILADNGDYYRPTTVGPYDLFRKLNAAGTKQMTCITASELVDKFKIRTLPARNACVDAMDERYEYANVPFPAMTVSSVKLTGEGFPCMRRLNGPTPFAVLNQALTDLSNVNEFKFIFEPDEGTETKAARELFSPLSPHPQRAAEGFSDNWHISDAPMENMLHMQPPNMAISRIVHNHFNLEPDKIMPDLSLVTPAIYASDEAKRMRFLRDQLTVYDADGTSQTRSIYWKDKAYPFSLENQDLAIVTVVRNIAQPVVHVKSWSQPSAKTLSVRMPFLKFDPNATPDGQLKVYGANMIGILARSLGVRGSMRKTISGRHDRDMPHKLNRFVFNLKRMFNDTLPEDCAMRYDFAERLVSLRWGDYVYNTSRPFLHGTKKVRNRTFQRAAREVFGADFDLGHPLAARRAFILDSIFPVIGDLDAMRRTIDDQTFRDSFVSQSNNEDYVIDEFNVRGGIPEIKYRVLAALNERVTEERIQLRFVCTQSAANLERDEKNVRAAIARFFSFPKEERSHPWYTIAPKSLELKLARMEDGKVEVVASAKCKDSEHLLDVFRMLKTTSPIKRFRRIAAATQSLPDLFMTVIRSTFNVNMDRRTSSGASGTAKLVSHASIVRSVLETVEERLEGRMASALTLTEFTKGTIRFSVSGPQTESETFISEPFMLAIDESMTRLERMIEDGMQPVDRWTVSGRDWRRISASSLVGAAFIGHPKRTANVGEDWSKYGKTPNEPLKSDNLPKGSVRTRWTEVGFVRAPWRTWSETPAVRMGSEWKAAVELEAESTTWHKLRCLWRNGVTWSRAHAQATSAKEILVKSAFDLFSTGETEIVIPDATWIRARKMSSVRVQAGDYVLSVAGVKYVALCNEARTTLLDPVVDDAHVACGMPLLIREDDTNPSVRVAFEKRDEQPQGRRLTLSASSSSPLRGALATGPEAFELEIVDWNATLPDVTIEDPANAGHTKPLVELRVDDWLKEGGSFYAAVSGTYTTDRSFNPMTLREVIASNVELEDATREALGLDRATKHSYVCDATTLKSGMIWIPSVVETLIVPGDPDTFTAWIGREHEIEWILNKDRVMRGSAFDTVYDFFQGRLMMLRERYPLVTRFVSRDVPLIPSSPTEAILRVGPRDARGLCLIEDGISTSVEMPAGRLASLGYSWETSSKQSGDSYMVKDPVFEASLDAFAAYAADRVDFPTPHGLSKTEFENGKSLDHAVYERDGTLWRPCVPRTVEGVFGVPFAPDPRETLSYATTLPDIRAAPNPAEGANKANTPGVDDEFEEYVRPDAKTVALLHADWDHLAIAEMWNKVHAHFYAPRPSALCVDKVSKCQRNQAKVRGGMFRTIKKTPDALETLISSAMADCGAYDRADREFRNLTIASRDLVAHIRQWCLEGQDASSPSKELYVGMDEPCLNPVVGDPMLLDPTLFHAGVLKRPVDIVTGSSRFYWQGDALEDRLRLVQEDALNHYGDRLFALLQLVNVVNEEAVSVSSRAYRNATALKQEPWSDEQVRACAADVRTALERNMNGDRRRFHGFFVRRLPKPPDADHPPRHLTLHQLIMQWKICEFIARGGTSSSVFNLSEVLDSTISMHPLRDLIMHHSLDTIGKFCTRENYDGGLFSLSKFTTIDSMKDAFEQTAKKIAANWLAVTVLPGQEAEFDDAVSKNLLYLDAVKMCRELRRTPDNDGTGLQPLLDTTEVTDKIFEVSTVSGKLQWTNDARQKLAGVHNRALRMYRQAYNRATDKIIQDHGHAIGLSGLTLLRACKSDLMASALGAKSCRKSAYQAEPAHLADLALMAYSVRMARFVYDDVDDEDDNEDDCSRYGPWAPFEDFGERKAFPLYSKFATNTMRGRTVQINVATSPLDGSECDPTIGVEAGDDKSLRQTNAPVATNDTAPQPFGLRGTYERVFTGPKEKLFTFRAGETIVFSDNGSVLHGPSEGYHAEHRILYRRIFPVPLSKRPMSKPTSALRAACYFMRMRGRRQWVRVDKDDLTVYAGDGVPGVDLLTNEDLEATRETLLRRMILLVSNGCEMHTLNQTRGRIERISTIGSLFSLRMGVDRRAFKNARELELVDRARRIGCLVEFEMTDGTMRYARAMAGGGHLIRMKDVAHMPSHEMQLGDVYTVDFAYKIDDPSGSPTQIDKVVMQGVSFENVDFSPTDTLDWNDAFQVMALVAAELEQSVFIEDAFTNHITVYEGLCPQRPPRQIMWEAEATDDIQERQQEDREQKDRDDRETKRLEDKVKLLEAQLEGAGVKIGTKMQRLGRWMTRMNSPHQTLVKETIEARKNLSRHKVLVENRTHMRTLSRGAPCAAYVGSSKRIESVGVNDEGLRRIRVKDTLGFATLWQKRNETPPPEDLVDSPGLAAAIEARIKETTDPIRSSSQYTRKEIEKLKAKIESLRREQRVLGLNFDAWESFDPFTASDRKFGLHWKRLVDAEIPRTAAAEAATADSAKALERYAPFAPTGADLARFVDELLDKTPDEDDVYAMEPDEMSECSIDIPLPSPAGDRAPNEVYVKGYTLQRWKQEDASYQPDGSWTELASDRLHADLAKGVREFDAKTVKKWKLPVVDYAKAYVKLTAGDDPTAATYFTTTEDIFVPHVVGDASVYEPLKEHLLKIHNGAPKYPGIDLKLWNDNSSRLPLPEVCINVGKKLGSGGREGWYRPKQKAGWLSYLTGGGSAPTQKMANLKEMEQTNQRVLDKMERDIKVSDTTVWQNSNVVMMLPEDMRRILPVPKLSEKSYIKVGNRVMKALGTPRECSFLLFDSSPTLPASASPVVRRRWFDRVKDVDPAVMLGGAMDDITRLYTEGLVKEETIHRRTIFLDGDAWKAAYEPDVEVLGVTQDGHLTPATSFVLTRVGGSGSVVVLSNHHFKVHDSVLGKSLRMTDVVYSRGGHIGAALASIASARRRVRSGVGAVAGLSGSALSGAKALPGSIAGKAGSLWSSLWSGSGANILDEERAEGAVYRSAGEEPPVQVDLNAIIEFVETPNPMFMDNPVVFSNLFMPAKIDVMLRIDERPALLKKDEGKLIVVHDDDFVVVEGEVRYIEWSGRPPDDKVPSGVFEIIRVEPHFLGNVMLGMVTKLDAKAMDIENIVGRFHTREEEKTEAEAKNVVNNKFYRFKNPMLTPFMQEITPYEGREDVEQRFANRVSSNRRLRDVFALALPAALKNSSWKKEYIAAELGRADDDPVVTDELQKRTDTLEKIKTRAREVIFQKPVELRSASNIKAKLGDGEVAVPVSLTPNELREINANLTNPKRATLIRETDVYIYEENDGMDNASYAMSTNTLIRINEQWYRNKYRPLSIDLYPNGGALTFLRERFGVLFNNTWDTYLEVFFKVYDVPKVDWDKICFFDLIFTESPYISVERITQRYTGAVAKLLSRQYQTVGLDGGNAKKICNRHDPLDRTGSAPVAASPKKCTRDSFPFNDLGDWLPIHIRNIDNPTYEQAMDINAQAITHVVYVPSALERVLRIFQRNILINKEEIVSRLCQANDHLDLVTNECMRTVAIEFAIMSNHVSAQTPTRVGAFPVSRAQDTCIAKMNMKLLSGQTVSDACCKVLGRMGYRVPSIEELALEFPDFASTLGQLRFIDLLIRDRKPMQNRQALSKTQTNSTHQACSSAVTAELYKNYMNFAGFFANLDQICQSYCQDDGQACILPCEKSSVVFTEDMVGSKITIEGERGQNVFINGLHRNVTWMNQTLFVEGTLVTIGSATPPDITVPKTDPSIIEWVEAPSANKGYIVFKIEYKQWGDEPSLCERVTLQLDDNSGTTASFWVKPGRVMNVAHGIIDRVQPKIGGTVVVRDEMRFEPFFKSIEQIKELDPAAILEKAISAKCPRAPTPRGKTIPTYASENAQHKSRIVHVYSGRLSHMDVNDIVVVIRQDIDAVEGVVEASIVEKAFYNVAHVDRNAVDKQYTTIFEPSDVGQVFRVEEDSSGAVVGILIGERVRMIDPVFRPSVDLKSKTTGIVKKVEGTMFGTVEYENNRGETISLVNQIQLTLITYNNPGIFDNGKGHRCQSSRTFARYITAEHRQNLMALLTSVHVSLKENANETDETMMIRLENAFISFSNTRSALTIPMNIRRKTFIESIQFLMWSRYDVNGDPNEHVFETTPSIGQVVYSTERKRFYVCRKILPGNTCQFTPAKGPWYEERNVDELKAFRPFGGGKQLNTLDDPMGRFSEYVHLRFREGLYMFMRTAILMGLPPQPYTRDRPFWNTMETSWLWAALAVLMVDYPQPNWLQRHWDLVGTSEKNAECDMIEVDGDSADRIRDITFGTEFNANLEQGDLMWHDLFLKYVMIDPARLQCAMGITIVGVPPDRQTRFPPPSYVARQEKVAIREENPVNNKLAREAISAAESVTVPTQVIENMELSSSVEIYKDYDIVKGEGLDKELAVAPTIETTETDSVHVEKTVPPMAEPTHLYPIEKLNEMRKLSPQDFVKVRFAMAPSIVTHEGSSLIKPLVQQDIFPIFVKPDEAARDDTTRKTVLPFTKYARRLLHKGDEDPQKEIDAAADSLREELVSFASLDKPSRNALFGQTIFGYAQAGKILGKLLPKVNKMLNNKDVKEMHTKYHQSAINAENMKNSLQRKIYDLGGNLPQVITKNASPNAGVCWNFGKTGNADWKMAPSGEALWNSLLGNQCCKQLLLNHDAYSHSEGEPFISTAYRNLNDANRSWRLVPRSLYNKRPPQETDTWLDYIQLLARTFLTKEKVGDEFFDLFKRLDRSIAPDIAAIVQTQDNKGEMFHDRNMAVAQRFPLQWGQSMMGTKTNTAMGTTDERSVRSTYYESAVASFAKSIASFDGKDGTNATSGKITRFDGKKDDMRYKTSKSHIFGEITFDPKQKAYMFGPDGTNNIQIKNITDPNDTSLRLSRAILDELFPVVPNQDKHVMYMCEQAEKQPEDKRSKFLMDSLVTLEQPLVPFDEFFKVYTSNLKPWMLSTIERFVKVHMADTVSIPDVNELKTADAIKTEVRKQSLKMHVVQDTLSEEDFRAQFLLKDPTALERTIKAHWREYKKSLLK